jgi:hypothetical protein
VVEGIEEISERRGHRRQEGCRWREERIYDVHPQLLAPPAIIVIGPEPNPPMKCCWNPYP